MNFTELEIQVYVSFTLAFFINKNMKEQYRLKLFESWQISDTSCINPVLQQMQANMIVLNVSHHYTTTVGVLRATAAAATVQRRLVHLVNRFIVD